VTLYQYVLNYMLCCLLYACAFNTYLTPVKDGLETVEQLKGRHNMTLHKNSSQDHRSRPPSCTDGHLEEPLLQRYLSKSAITAAAAEYCVHDEIA